MLVNAKTIHAVHYAFDDGSHYYGVKCFVPEMDEVVSVKVDKEMTIPFGADVDLELIIKGKRAKYRFVKGVK